MAELSWTDVGARLFETGLDRGVLYVGEDPGVAWPGLLEVSKSFTGGEARPQYVDGVKFQNTTTPEEIELSLSALYSPEEFDICDGTALVGHGLFMHSGVRREFGLSYRTKIGNDVEGSDHGHKIHLVYNATASPSNQSLQTEAENPDLSSLSWQITTRPFPLPNGTRSAHFFLDTTRASELLTNWLDETLYGTDTTPPRLPGIEEIITIEPGVYDTALYDYDYYGLRK